MKTFLLCMFFPLLVFSSYADDEPPKLKELKTLTGKTFKEVVIKSVTADEISIIHSGGATTISFDQIPMTIREEIGMQSLWVIKQTEDKEKAKREKKSIDSEKLKEARLLALEAKMVSAYKNFQFGNSYSRVIDKINSDDSIKLKYPKQEKNSTDTIYAETTLSGMTVNLYFAFYENALCELIFMTPPTEAENYATLVRKSHDVFLKVLASKYPKPKAAFGFPDIKNLQKNRITYSYVWKFSDKHLKLGVATNETEYSAYIAIADSAAAARAELKELEQKKKFAKDAATDF